jgi:hypothetical protein
MAERIEDPPSPRLWRAGPPSLGATARQAEEEDEAFDGFFKRALRR